MFSPPKQQTFALTAAIVTMLATGISIAHAQQGRTQYSRYEAMQRAQARAVQDEQDNYDANYDANYDSPPAATRMSQMQPLRARPIRTARLPVQQVAGRGQNASDRTAIVGGPAGNTRSYVPQHLRTAQRNGDPIVGGGSPIANQSNPNFGGQVVGSQVMDLSAPMVSQGLAMEGEIISDGGCRGGCGGGCGLGDCYFDACTPCDPCANRNGGCAPEYYENCWLGGLFGLLGNGEYLFGAQAFRSPGTQVRDNADGLQNIQDSSFGFYTGFNFGIPLCKLTCGLLSGQFGVRAAFSEFDGNNFTSDSRQQVFYTAGLYRRVDYGWQAGVVVDVLQDNWFIDTDFTQVRGDLSWVYGPSALGFRFASGTDESVVNGTINGVSFDNLTTRAIDNYRFYYRTNMTTGGYFDLVAGWSDERHAVLGMEADVPMGEIWGLQSGFTYFLPDQDIPGLNADAWNVFMGIVLRPRGRLFYGNYDRPLLPVADNGSMVLRRIDN